jgi:uncharacterized repeat protein (TIGR01451 family)
MLKTLIACLLAALTGALAAQSVEQAVTELIAEVRINGSGEQPTRYVPATVLSQGDVVYYTVRIVNPTPSYLPSVEVVQRVPANTTYVAQSAAGPAAEVTFSADGGASFASARELTELTPEGKTVPVPTERYTHIRWRLRHALAPGAVALARFQSTFR